MIEISNLSRKVISDLAMALSSYTPEYIRACSQAEADGLKLTTPEQKKRDEYTALLATTEKRIKELKEAEMADAISKKSLTEWAQKLADQETILKKAKDDHNTVAQELANKQKAHAQKQKELDDYNDHLNSVAEAQKKEDARLAEWRSSLSEEAANFEKAQLLVLRKK